MPERKRWLAFYLLCAGEFMIVHAAFAGLAAVIAITLLREPDPALAKEAA